MRRSAIGLASLVLACAPAEAPRIELPVVVDGSGLAAHTTDLGWTIEFDQARMAVADFEFAGADELARQPSVGAWLIGLLLPTAHAHPGHEESGQVIGELTGTFVLDFIAGDGVELGDATLIVGEYGTANFHFRRATADELSDGDPLIGHTALLAGTASKEGQVITFSIAIDSPPDYELIGASFEYTLTETSMVELGVRLLDTDDYDGDHLLHGIDFAALDGADGSADGMVALIDPELDPALPAALATAYAQIRGDFETHEMFEIQPREP